MCPFMQDDNNCENTLSFRDESIIEDKERISSSGRYQESTDNKNHLELNRQKDENNEIQISIVHSVTAV